MKHIVRQQDGLALGIVRGSQRDRSVAARLFG